MRGDTGLAEYVCDQLRDWAPVEARRMFGGCGLFRDGRMFALIFDEQLYLKADAETASAFDRIQAPAFTYQRDGRLVSLSYRLAPESVLDDAEALREWVQLAWAAAVRSRPGSKPRRRARVRSG